MAFKIKAKFMIWKRTIVRFPLSLPSPRVSSGGGSRSEGGHFSHRITKMPFIGGQPPPLHESRDRLGGLESWFSLSPCPDSRAVGNPFRVKCRRWITNFCLWGTGKPLATHHDGEATKGSIHPVWEQLLNPPIRCPFCTQSASAGHRRGKQLGSL